MVTKVYAVENGPAPAELRALTRQKYWELFCNGPTMREVVVREESSSTIPDEKLPFVATCRRYVAAPLTAFQTSVRVVGVPV